MRYLHHQLMRDVADVKGGRVDHQMPTRQPPKCRWTRWYWMGLDPRDHDLRWKLLEHGDRDFQYGVSTFPDHHAWHALVKLELHRLVDTTMGPGHDDEAACVLLHQS